MLQSLPNPVKNFITTLPRLKNQVMQGTVGLAHDFWKDGTDNPLHDVRGLGKKIRQKITAKLTTKNAADKKPVSARPRPAFIWQALPGEVAEKMWGDNAVVPGDELLTETLTAQLQLTNASKVLDLSAGLGARMRKLAKTYGAQVTGLDMDPHLAERGTELMALLSRSKNRVNPIVPFNPAQFSSSQLVDCILARDIFYRVADKETFFRAIADTSSPKAQLAFTDYIVNPEDAGNPAIKAWQTAELDAKPLGLVEMAEAWAKNGFMISVHDDQTEFYRREIMLGLQRLAIFLGSGVKPDAATKQEILRHTEIWVRRAAALQNGLKFYRFYGAKG